MQQKAMMDEGKETPIRAFSREKQRAIEKKRRQEFEIHCEGLQGMAMLMRYKALCAAQYQDETPESTFRFDFQSLWLSLALTFFHFDFSSL